MVSGTSWSNGQSISSSLTIAAGTTVTIDPGATINMGSGVTVTVLGTLSASSASSHAKLTGSSWVGLVVGSGGTLNLDGVDITGASAALDIQGGGTAEYDDGTIANSAATFNVAKAGSLTTKHATFSGAAGACNVAGSFTASFLTYTGGGSGFFDGITTTDPTAQLSVEDSTFTGPGANGPLHDMLVSNTAAKFHVAYTSISHMHCGFHFNSLSEFDISYVNDDSEAYGFMLYGSGGAGPFTVSYSNLYSNAGDDYSTLGSNGPITFDHVYRNGMVDDVGMVVTVTNPESAMVAGTGPR
jgi:hypothetical protein